MVKMFYNYFEKCDKYRKRGISVKKKGFDVLLFN